MLSSQIEIAVDDGALATTLPILPDSRNTNGVERYFFHCFFEIIGLLTCSPCGSRLFFCWIVHKKVSS